LLEVSCERQYSTHWRYYLGLIEATQSTAIYRPRGSLPVKPCLDVIALAGDHPHVAWLLTKYVRNELGYSVGNCSPELRAEIANGTTP
jgi:hypothetical protein